MLSTKFLAVTYFHPHSLVTSVQWILLRIAGKMAAFIVSMQYQRRQLRRNRVFRDRSNPFERYDDVELYRKFRFRREDILAITEEVEADITLINRRGTMPPLLQVLTALRFYATGSFQEVCGEVIGIHQSTVSRTITRVTEALLKHVAEYVHLPTQEEAEGTKLQYFRRNGFPNAVGAIDGTQVRIQAPSHQEHEYVNRKSYHSINVQVRWHLIFKIM